MGAVIHPLGYKPFSFSVVRQGSQGRIRPIQMLVPDPALGSRKSEVVKAFSLYLKGSQKQNKSRYPIIAH